MQKPHTTSHGALMIMTVIVGGVRLGVTHGEAALLSQHSRSTPSCPQTSERDAHWQAWTESLNFAQLMDREARKLQTTSATMLSSVEPPSSLRVQYRSLVSFERPKLWLGWVVLRCFEQRGSLHMSPACLWWKTPTTSCTAKSLEKPNQDGHSDGPHANAMDGGGR